MAIVGDWDIDGAVSSAEIFYSQAVLGLYPVKGVKDVVLVPTSARSVADAIKNIVVDHCVKYVVFLDIAYSKYMDIALSLLRSKDIGILYVDHHISTAINIDVVKAKVDLVVIGKTSTSMLVYSLLKSIGIDVSERLKAFIKAVTVIERGDREYNIKPVDKKLIDITASLSRTLTSSKDKEMWIKVIKWLTEPMPMIALPFATNIKKFIQSSTEYMRELKALANEIAISCLRLFNIRFIDIRSKNYRFKSTAIASALHRLLKTPIILLSRNSQGKDILVIKSSNSFAYDVAMYLYKKGIVEDVIGHQTLIIILLKPGIEKEKIINSIREFLVNGPAGI